MSITNTKAKSVYNANGTTTEWNLGFTYNDTVSNVHIYIVDANDNETEVTSNYSIADGVLTYPTTASGLEPLAEGNKLVIVRDTPRTQDIELTSNGKLDGKVLEGGYDKLTLQVQELTEQVNRAVKIPVTEDSADNFLDPITAITEAKKEALVEIAQATTPAEVAKETAVAKAQVATEQATIATNAATSAKAAQVGAEQAEQNATAQAEKAENAVTAFVEGLGTAKNAVIDLGIFDGKTSVTSSRTIEFDKKPIAVSLRFSDTNKKLWINGTNSTVGIEVIDNTHCNLFYSIASADFVGQNAVKGPFVVQAIIQYSLLDNSATETEMGAVQLATKVEAEAGTNDTKAMTPLKTKYAIEANATVQTLRNDIDDLGDQVSEIEAKIPGVATTSTLGVVKPDGNTITVTEDGTISATVSGDNVATKAELQAVDSSKVSKAGDTMTGTLTLNGYPFAKGQRGKVYFEMRAGGTDSRALVIKATDGGSNEAFLFIDPISHTLQVSQEPQAGANDTQLPTTSWVRKYGVNKTGDTMTGLLKMSGPNEVRFGTDDNFYYIKHNNAGNFDINIIKDGKIYGVFLDAQDNYALHYRKDQEFYRLLTTADLDNIDYVVESQVNVDGSWYRKYKSGWIEQGGITSILNGSSGKTVTFLKPMANNYYTVNIAFDRSGHYFGCSASQLTTTNMKVVNNGSDQSALRWFIIGQGAN